MNIEIIVTDSFSREYKHLKKKYPSLDDDMKLLKDELLANPDKGVDLGGGYRKIRLSIASKGKGKSGGARIISYNIILNDLDGKIFLLSIYDKSERDTISIETIKKLKDKLDL